MIERRKVVFALGAGVLGAHFSAFAQQPSAKIHRIGFLAPTTAAAFTVFVAELRGGLRELGYIEGRNIAIEFRWAEGKYERLPALATELVKLKVDVIVAAATPSIKAAQRVTATVPIVMAQTGDPVGTGIIKSFSHPGGNITGLSNINADTSSKYLELLRVAVPKLSRVAVLAYPGHPVHPIHLKNIEAAAKGASVSVLPIQANSAAQIEAAFGPIVREHANALIVMPDSFFRSQVRLIADQAVKAQLPTMFWSRELAEAGGLMSYGQNDAEHYRLAAGYIDKILKGAKPAELPVEQPTRLEFVINRKTARALGLSISNELLLRADKVIE